MIKYAIVLFVLFGLQSSFAGKKYLQLPSGANIEIKDGETAQQAWFAAMKKYPEDFGLKQLSDGEKFDVDYFNECKLKAAKSTVSQAAMFSAIQACEYKAVPKKCRIFPVTKDSLGNEVGAERTKCVQECTNANAYAKSFVECGKG
jgi:hypothetical protein